MRPNKKLKIALWFSAVLAGLVILVLAISLAIVNRMVPEVEATNKALGRALFGTATADYLTSTAQATTRSFSSK